MKRKSFLMVLTAAGALALSAQAADVDQLKSDLLGQTMGGREKCWKFQSPDQIRNLTIKKKDEDLRKRVCIVALQLQATKGGPRYAAEARVEYARTGSGWKVQQVGLLSLTKVE